jgi:hypothetical protein
MPGIKSLNPARKHKIPNGRRMRVKHKISPSKKSIMASGILMNSQKPVRIRPLVIAKANQSRRPKIAKKIRKRKKRIMQSTSFDQDM